MKTNPPPPRLIRLAHDSPGRLRLRLPELRNQPGVSTALADHLAQTPGVVEVAVRPRTGSVLCRYDERHTTAAKLIAAVRRQPRAATRRREGEASPRSARAVRPQGSSVARALADAFRAFDDEIFNASSGRVDLGTLAGLGLLGAGAAEVIMTRELPAPPWFSLAWWALRTFTMFEASPRSTPAPRAARQHEGRRQATAATRP